MLGNRSILKNRKENQRLTRTYTHLMEMGCEDGRWMELAKDRVQWWAWILAVLNLCVLLPES